MRGSILLTGADGFTGQHFITEATARDYQVQALTSDLTNPESIAKEISGKSFDYIVHLAAISAVTHTEALDFYQINLFGTLNLLDAISAEIPPPKKILVASSANIYGNATESPIRETALPAPENHYAMSKLAMEYMLGQFRQHLPIVTVRPFNYTGVGHDDRFIIPKLINHFVDRSEWVELGNISVEREFNDVRTVCRTYVELLSEGLNNEAYNICSGTTHSLTQVMETLSRLTGHTMEVRVNENYVRANEVQRLCGNPEKLEGCIGPIAHPPLEKTLQWMLDAALR